MPATPDDPLEPAVGRPPRGVAPWNDDDRARALLVAWAPATATLAGVRAPDPGVPWSLLAVATGLALLLAASAWRLRPGVARLMAGSALSAWAGLWLVAHADQPGVGLVVMLLVVGAFTVLWPPVRFRGEVGVGLPPTLLASLVALGAAWLAWRVGDDFGVIPTVGLLGSGVVAAVVNLGIWRSRGPSLVALLGVLAWGATRLADGPWQPTSLFLVVPLGLLVVGPTVRRILRERESWLDLLLASPPRVVVVSFVGLCLLGALLLGSPIADARGRGVEPIDAAFTAVSAVCVTGLTVLDTARDYSFFGQVAILVLIQLGGLGIMTLASVAVIWAGRRISVLAESATVQALGEDARTDLAGALLRVVRVTAIAETVGAALLLPAFVVEGMPLPRAAWHAVFTSISAFCNAGFALRSDNLVGFAENPWVLGVVGSLVIVGGLGPAVVVELPQLWRRREVSLHTRLVVTTSTALVLGGTLLVLLFERQHTLLGLAPADRLVNAWFLAVMPRTAGFNAVDLSTIGPATWTLHVLLMFVGGSPGSTAGGAKTTTVAVIALAILGTLKGRGLAEVGMRRIPHRTVYDALSVAVVGLVFVVAAVTAMQLTQDLPLDVIVFEVVSAVGTVGLTIGGTPGLDEVGKVIVMGCMFAGRVGPLTLFAVLAERRRSSGLSYPEESVAVG